MNNSLAEKPMDSVEKINAASAINSNSEIAVDLPKSSSKHINFSKQVSLNMPQMAFSGISENWLLKEFGDIHWRMICDGLETTSNKIVDSSGNRLYASFVRIRFESSHPLQSYCENDHLNFEGKITQNGSKMFLSQISMDDGFKKNNASLMTVFVTRITDNKSLTKSSPVNIGKSKIKIVNAMPDFGKEYVKIKSEAFKNSDKPENQEIQLGKEYFQLNHNNIFSMDYRIDPYNDLNGVNLLYFASYPKINDICEREYFNALRDETEKNDDWALSTSVICRDVFYYGNCDINDEITFVLNNYEFLDNYQIKLSSSLIRKKDNFPIATLFTIKQLLGFR